MSLPTAVTLSWKRNAAPRFLLKERRDRPLELGQRARPIEAENQTLRTGAGETVPNKKPNKC